MLLMAVRMFVVVVVGFLIGSSAFENVTQQMFWSVTTWLKCWSYLLFTSYHIY